MKAQLLILIALFTITSSTSPAQIPYGNNNDVGKYIQLNGVKHYYEVYGEGPPLLLIHGNRTGIPGFAPQIEYFAKKYKVYSIDCRGRGHSEAGTDSLTFEGMAKDLSEFIDKLKLDSVCIIGKSDGAIIALLMAIHYPKQIRKIAAFAPNVEPDTNSLYPETVQSIHDERIEAEKMLAKKDTSRNWLVEKWRLRLDEFQPHIPASDLNKIEIPVLIMAGDRDVIKEEHILFIYRNIKYSNLAILTGESHHVASAHPEIFNQTIDRYFSDMFKTRSYRFQ